MKKNQTSLLARVCALSAAVCVGLQSVPMPLLANQPAQVQADEEKEVQLVNIASSCEITADRAESGRPASNLVDGDESTLWVKSGGGFPTTVQFKLPADNTKKIKKVNIKFEQGHTPWGVDVKLSHVLSSVVDEPIMDNSKHVGFDDGYSYTWEEAALFSHINIELSNPTNGDAAGAFWPAMAEVEIWAEDDTQTGEIVNVASEANVSSCSNGGTPANLADGNYSSLYVFHNGGISTIQGEAWVQASLGKNYMVHSLEVAVENVPNDSNGFVFNFDVLGKSKGDKEWNALFTDQRATRLTGENIVELSFAEPVPLSDIRLRLNSLTSTGGDPWPAFAELKIFAEKQPDSEITEDPGNIAFKKTVHTNLGANTIERLNDGNTATTWNAERYPAYADIDLEENYNLEDIEMYLPEGPVSRYSIYTSMDGSNYSLAVRKDDDSESEGMTVHSLAGIEARYVRVYMEYQSASEKAQVNEVRVHGTPSGTPLQSAPEVNIPDYADTAWNTPVTDQDTIEEVQGIVSRRLGEQYKDWFDFEVKASESGNDEYDLSVQNGKVHISGNTGVAMAMGLNYYLKYYCNVQISEMVEQVHMPEQMPVFEGTIHRQTPLKVRYAYNYCTHSYTMSFFGEDEWRNEIDWLALNGVNIVLDVTGQEEVWRRFLMELGYSHQEAKDFVAGPAYSAWFNMANMTGFGGPVHDKHFEKRTELARKNHKIMEKLGMQPAVQGYCGMVPTDIAQKDPDAKIINQGMWQSFPRPAMLRTDSDTFTEYAEIFYRVQEEVFGDQIHYYATDPFHEGGNTGGMSPQVISSRVIDALTTADPDGVWIIQAWGSNPTPGLIAGLEGKQDHALVLDLYAEKLPRWSNTSSYGGKEFGGTPWVYCMLNNFGGRMGLHGHMSNFASQVAEAYQNADHMTGIGITPEASQNNPILYDMFFETAWTEGEELEEIDIDAWLQKYAERAYGSRSESAIDALRIMNETVYNPSLNMNGQGAPETVINARPAESIGAASSWGTCTIGYDKAELERALKLMLADYDTLKTSDAYIYDLAALAQQVISNTAQEYHKKMVKAIHNGDAESFELYSNRFLDLIDFSETVLSTQIANLLGTWVGSALRMAEGTDDFTNDLYELNAKALITTWGSLNQANAGGLRDYSNRQWAGLTRDYYKPRWQAWINEQKKRIAGEDYKNFNSTDWFRMEWKWATGHTEYTDQKSDADLKPIVEQLLSTYSVSEIPREPAEDDSRDIDTALLTAASGSEQYTTGDEGPAANVLDGDTSTLWHTKWAGDEEANLWIDLALESPTDVYGIRLLPRQYGTNAIIKKCRVEISTDHGQTYTELTTADLDTSTEWKLIDFGGAQNVTNVRLYSLDNVTNQSRKYASLAEMRLIGAEKGEEESDKRLLAMAVEIAETQSLENVHPSVKAHFEKALNDAKAVLSNTSATQEEVNEAWISLSNAIHMLSFTADKSGLQALVDECSAIDLSEYKDDENKTAFVSALEAAKAVLKNPNALDETSIIPALNALSEAKGALVLKDDTTLDYTTLQLIVDASLAVDTEKYMSDTLPAFVSALASAQDVLAGADSQEEIDQAANTLHDAYLDLRLKADEELLRQLKEALDLLKSVDQNAVKGTEYEEQLLSMIGRMSAAVEKSEVSADEVKALISDAKSLYQAVKDLKPAASNSNNQNVSASGSKQAQSVQTAAKAGQGLYAGLSAAALGVLALLKRRNRK